MTRLRDIQVSVGRTGALTPFAVLEPVVVGGARVSVATLHNAEQVQAKGLLIGDDVIVQRAGEVIPEVVGPVLSAREGREDELRPFEPPERCPVCETPVVTDGPSARCPNLRCPPRVARTVEHFVSRGAMDIEGFGSRPAYGARASVADIYGLFIERRKDMLALKGCENERREEQSARPQGQRRCGDCSTIIFAQIEASKQRPLRRLLVALSIRHVGARDRASTSRCTSATSAHLRAAGVEVALSIRHQIEAIDGVGPIVAQALHEYLEDDANAAEIARLAEAGTSAYGRRHVGARPGRWRCDIVVVTGALERWSRNEAEALIKELGGRVSGAVGKQTSYLLAGAGGGAKRTKAEELETLILSEDEFIARLRERGWEG